MGEPKYRDDEKGNEYSNIESFQNRTFLPKIKIQENQKKKKGNTLSLREEERKHMSRLTSKNYQTSKEEEEKKE